MDTLTNLENLIDNIMKLQLTLNIDEVHAAQALERFIKNNPHSYGDSKRVQLYLSLLKKINTEATKDDLVEFMPRDKKFVLDETVKVDNSKLSKTLTI